MTFFLNSHLGLSRSLRSNENRGWIFEAATSNFCNHSWNFGSSPRNGKVDLCTTNGSIVLIYLTLLNFLLHYLQEYSKIWNIEKSNKSELWNRLSYRGLPYHFEVRSQTLFYDFQKFEVAASKFRGWFSFDLNDLERPNWEFKKNVMG